MKQAVTNRGALTASVHNLARARYRNQQSKAELVEEWTRDILGPENAAQLGLAVAGRVADPDTDKWTFAMISPSQNYAVIEWIGANSKRPQAAVKLWGYLLTALRPDTGEILLNRSQISDKIGILPRDVSSIMTELATINAIKRVKEGRTVRYFINPSIATHLPGPEARRAARVAAGPLLLMMEGGKA